MGIHGVAHIGHHAASHQIALDKATVHKDIGVLQRGQQQSHHFAEGVVVELGVELVHAYPAIGVATVEHTLLITCLAVVVTVRSAVDIGVHHGVAGDDAVGGAVVLRPDVAAHVVTGKDVEVAAARQVDTTGVFDVGATAAAVHVFGDNL